MAISNAQIRSGLGRIMLTIPNRNSLVFLLSYLNACLHHFTVYRQLPHHDLFRRIAYEG